MKVSYIVKVAPLVSNIKIYFMNKG